MEYAIGLDIGTNSVGWCAIDKNNALMKVKGKKLWGVRLFEEGKSAAETRIKRGQRRRYLRRKRRIRLLQELMGDLIKTIDPTFFIRLEDSFLFKEDKRLENEYTLFADKHYTDSDYYKQYPTIYHLRSELIHTTEKKDPRLIYLACHHMIKYRGHFLYEGQNFQVAENGIADIVEELIQLLKEQDHYEVGQATAQEITKYLEDSKQRKRVKQDEMIKYLSSKQMDKKLAAELVKAMIGNSFNLAILFHDQEIVNDTGKAYSVKFSDGSYEVEQDTIEAKLQDRFVIVEKLHKIYSQYTLQNILQGEKFISDAMLVKYNKHKEDLKVLKRLIRAVNPKEYNSFFRESNQKDIKNYVSYIEKGKKCTQEELYQTIKKLLKGAPKQNPDYEYCMKEMEDNNFLNRLNHIDNAAIPWQMNKEELACILDTQGKYYPLLKENKEKIMSLLSFRIPYYVGPLNAASRFAWIERTEEKIYPWNFFDIINEEKTAQNFIERMTNYCTYLPGKKVIPKYSLLYSEFNVLNELANMRINGKRLEPADKKKIVEDLFKHYKRITHQRFCDWLKKNQWHGQSEFEIEGYQKENEFASSLESTLDFYKILQKTPNRAEEEMIEQIIYWLTIFEERSIVEKKIRQQYAEVLSEEQIKKIIKLKYKGWSRLSKELLTQLQVKRDEISYNIMDYLRNTKMNFMQIISDKELGFNQLIEAEQEKVKKEDISLEDIQALPGSPALKRGIWQTVQIVDEIIKFIGENPSQIILEVARSDEEKKRTASRKNKLIKAFEQLKNETDEYNEQIVKELKNYENQLDKEKVLLYFLQNGKCLYTQKELHLDQLMSYEVDHIMPRCYIKDDSIENKALVYKEENQRKSGDLLLNPDIQKNNRTWWLKLHKCGLLGSKKLENLLREGISEKEQKGFIQRQLVETRQICKHIACLFEMKYKQTAIVLVKAQLSTLFREKYELYKCRTLNDLHHAQDAYLVAVIGNTLLLNHKSDSAEWIYNDYIKYDKNMKLSRKQKQGYVLSMFEKEIADDEGHVVWHGEESLKEVLKVFNYKNCFITKKLEEGTGEFYNATINSRDGSNKKMVPLKEGLSVEKYGGYNNVNNAYSVAIAYKNKKKIEKKLVGIPIKIAYDIRIGKITLDSYLEGLGYPEIQILRKKVLKYQLMLIENEPFFITSHQEICNARQLMLDKEAQQLIYWIEKQNHNELEAHLQELNSLYEHLLNKVKQYYTGYNSVWKKIEEVFDFDKLTLNERCMLILEILNLTKANATQANLKRINSKLSDRAGRKSGPVKLDGVTFVNQSITGLYERRETF